MEYVARTPEQLGTILRGNRTLLALTQQAAGAKVGLKQSTVSALENAAGASRIESLYKLISALNLELVLRERGYNDGDRVREW